MGLINIIVISLNLFKISFQCALNLKLNDDSVYYNIGLSNFKKGENKTANLR